MNINMTRRTFLMSLLSAPLVSSAQGHTVQTWGRWEHTLTSDKHYQNPGTDVLLNVTYRGPKGSVITGLGFWDGGDIFKIRAMFSLPGRWEWETSCSDAANQGLHRQHGEVDVKPYHGSNPLYRRGYLQVSSNRRYLTHKDGTPFLWIGDTAWAAPMNAAREDWKTYVADRVKKRFSVLQISCAEDWQGSNDWQGDSPLLQENPMEINPSFGRQYEQKVEYANQQGLAVAIVGLMEPVHRYPSAPSAQAFARQLVARLMGNFVIFSPSFDSPYMELANLVGSTIRESTSMHLITQHPGTGLSASIKYRPQPYLDISGEQTGAGWGGNPISADIAARNAVDWSLALYRLQPVKPIVDLESRYDSDFGEKQLARMPRSCGYWSLLSGCVGYTYGCAGIWNWGVKDGGDPQESPWDWRKGMDRESSTQIMHLSTFLNELKWWLLEPHSEYVLNQSSEPTKYMPLAAAARGDLVVAYLPDNDSIQISASRLSTVMSVQWLNPKTGERMAKDKIKKTGDSITLQRPMGWEDALLVLRKT